MVARVIAPALALVACAGSEDDVRDLWFFAMEGERPTVGDRNHSVDPELESVGAPILDFSSPVDAHRRVRFERVRIAGITDRPVHAEDDYDHGTGIALLDYDGDGDLDLFLGAARRGDPACVFENRSEPGNFGFAEHLCFPDIEWAAGGFGVDIDGDGSHELVITGPDVAMLVDVTSGVRTDLIAQATERDGCAAGAVAAHDFDLDGRTDLMIACHARSPGDGVRANFTLRQSRDGWEEFVGLGGTDDAENTLAFAVIDIDEDGLLDVFVVNDTYSNPHARRLLNAPGAIWRRCDPTEPCFDTPQRVLEGPERWGSFMGVGNVHVEGLGDALFITDWGPNRLVRVEDGIGTDHAEELGLGLGLIDPGSLGYNLGFDGLLPLFSWGVAVDDFDFDGRDDIFVTQGLVPALSGDAAFAYHFPLLGLQTRSGSFELLDAIDGVAVPTHVDSYPSDHPASSRGIAKADLDGDGTLELLVAPQAGVVQIYREVPAVAELPGRCTLRPRNWAVPSFGFGYAVRGDDGVYRRRDVGGQLLTGTSPWVFGPERRGTLRFPSGYEIPFDCGEGAVVDLVEPEWIRIERSGDRVSIAVETAVDALEIHGRAPDGVARHVITSMEASAEFDAEEFEAVILRVNSRWVARWWEI